MQDIVDIPVTFSPQQNAVIEFARSGSGSTVVEAVAGSGKTTTIFGVVDAVLGQVAIVAYAKPISIEIQGKLEKRKIDWRKAKGGTAHSFAFNSYRSTFKGAAVDEKERKVPGIIAELVAKGIEALEQATKAAKEAPADLFVEVPAQDASPWPFEGTLPGLATSLMRPLRALVSMAKQRGIGLQGGPALDDMGAWLDIVHHFDILTLADAPDTASLDAREFARWGMLVLRESIKRTDLVDFDDMIYMALYYNVKIWRYDVVIIDEAQDTNPVRRLLFKRMLKPGGRMFAFGDRHQGIFGFTGADHDALDLIRAEFAAGEMPLTVSFRCPRAVVRFARQWVSHIESAPEAPEGYVGEIDEAELVAHAKARGQHAAILCRVNKPLVRLAFTLIRARVPCRIEGRHDIGAKLVDLAERWKTVKTLDDLDLALDDYVERMEKKLAAKEAALAELRDVVETLRVIMDQCRIEGRTDVGAVAAYVDALFGTNVKGVLVLSSIHKAKGKEWDTVFWYDRAGTCPSFWAKQAWQQAQEANLCYVAATRARSALIEVIAEP